ncbi:MAG: AEC family transporter [Coprococcus sp.]
MQEILVRAGCFVIIIILGFVLRRINFFHEEDFNVLSKIALKITLPAAIIYSFSGKEIDPTMLLISLIGLGGGILYMVLAWLMNLNKSKEQQAFEILNESGYNIGNFTLPFAQSFLGPVGVITTSLFDIGNAVICLGGSYSVASIVKGDGRFSVAKIIKALTKSVAFDCYIVMILMKLIHISTPSAVVSLAEIISNANAFVAMLMIGVGFKISGNRRQIGDIARMLTVRYGVALLMALGCFFLLPLPLEMRQALVILVFSPIASAAPPFTAELKGDVGLSSAVNSISIVFSLIFIVLILLIIL